MATVCSRCRGVFYSNAGYQEHLKECTAKYEASHVANESKKLDKAAVSHVDVGAQVKTKGLPIQERLQKLCPDDRTGHIHESMTVFQSLAMHLAGRTHVEEKVFLAAVDVRCLILGLHALCDRIEGESVP